MSAPNAGADAGGVIAQRHYTKAGIEGVYTL